MKTFAFISYSRKDKEIATKIHEKLEHYPYSQNLVSENDKPNDDKYIRPIFIDTKDLPVKKNSFTDDIKRELQDAKYLIIICSANSYKSEYVNQETKYFLKTHNNDLSYVIPFVIDNVKGSIPQILIDNGILSRNLPVYNSRIEFSSESNKYCFYHLVAYLLNIDFTLLYDRYLQYEKKKSRKKTTYITIVISLLIFSIIFLARSLNNQIKYTKIQEEYTTFEKKIFPLSIVFGYEKNFLTPTIEYFKKGKENNKIYILMPENIEDLSHQERIEETLDILNKNLDIDSLRLITLPTKMKRGTILTKIYGGDINYDNLYIDFASTTSTFKRIIEYKKTNEFYKNISSDELLKEYTNTFIMQANELLKDDSCYVEFFTKVEDMINEINRNHHKK